MTAQKGAGQSATDVSNYVEMEFCGCQDHLYKAPFWQDHCRYCDQVWSSQRFRQPFQQPGEAGKVSPKTELHRSPPLHFSVDGRPAVPRGDPRRRPGQETNDCSSNNVGVIHLFEFKWRCLSYILDIMFCPGQAEGFWPDAAQRTAVWPSYSPKKHSWKLELAIGFGKVILGSLGVCPWRGVPEAVWQRHPPSHEAQLAPGNPARKRAYPGSLEASHQRTRERIGRREGPAAERKQKAKRKKMAPTLAAMTTCSSLLGRPPTPCHKAHPSTGEPLPTKQSECIAVSSRRAALQQALFPALSNSTCRVAKLESPAILVHMDTSLLGETTGPSCQEGLRKNWRPDEALLQKLLGSALTALGAQQDKNGKCTTPGEGVLAAVIDPLNVVPKGFLKDSTAQTVWLCFNEDSGFSLACMSWCSINSLCSRHHFFTIPCVMKESIRGRKKKVRGHSYTQRLELTLYSDKGLGVILPEKPRQIYSGTSSGDIIGFVTAMPISQMWKMSRIDYVC